MYSKSFFLSVIACFFCCGVSAQLKVGDNPQTIQSAAALEVESTNKGVLLPRINTLQRNTISNPPSGLMIYNTDLNCLQVNNGTPAMPDWRCLQPEPAGSVTTLDCSGVVNNGRLNAGMIASLVNSVLTYTGGNGGPIKEKRIPSTGVTGLTASLEAGRFAIGPGTITLQISGTPSRSGTAVFELNIGGQLCTLTRTVTDPVGIAPGIGSFTGQNCFDIALSNDNSNACSSLSNRTARKANFTQPATHTQSYIFTPVGTVSNVRFAFVNTNGEVVAAISGGNNGNNISTAVTATVNYNTNLNTLAYGLTNSNPLTANLFVIYNDGFTNNGIDRMLKLTVQVKDCICCGAFIAPGVWKPFMCHNMGANPYSDPLSPSWEITGNYYQWGRNTNITAGNPRYGASGPADGSAGGSNAGAVTGMNTTAAANGAWADASKTANDPCPAGFRVPTKTQWDGMIANNGMLQYPGTWTAGSTNYSTGLRIGQNLLLPAAGHRDFSGTLTGRGSIGRYWSTSVFTSTNGWYLYFNTGFATTYNANRLFSYSVRCIEE